MTSHFLTDENDYKSVNLETSSWDPELKKTGPLIRAKVDQLAADWGVKLVNTPFTVDGGGNVINAIRAEGSGLVNWEVDSLPVYNCAAHKLNNCVRDVLGNKDTVELSGMKVLQALNAGKKLTQHAKQSSLNAALEGKKLKQEVSTRWNSHYDMLKSVVNAWDDLEKLSTQTEEAGHGRQTKLKYPKLIDLLEDVELQLVKEICDFLKPIKVGKRKYYEF